MSQTHLSAFTADSSQGDYKKKLFNQAASGTATEQIAAVTGKVIRVIGLYMATGGTATNITFNSASTAITPLLALGINGTMVLPINEAGWFETVVSEALTVTTGAGSTTGVHLIYVTI